jgi:hypothetical protein
LERINKLRDALTAVMDLTVNLDRAVSIEWTPDDWLLINGLLTGLASFQTVLALI